MVAPLSTVGVTRYHRPLKNFTTLRNSFVRDAKISLRAFRVGALVLSHAAGYIQTQAQLATATGLSVNTVRAALRDLAQDGYLASKIVRENGRVIGTAYAVSDTPFTDAELAQLSADDVPSGPCAESAYSKSAPPKKTRSRRDSSTGEEDQPSGGAADADSIEGHATPEEEPMPIATDPAQAQLFDVESPEPPPAEQRKPQGAQAVIAAYVDSWRQHHAEGEEPLRADKGRIARDTNALLRKQEATQEELLAAAAELGRSHWANIATQVKMIRRRRTGSGNTPAVPEDHPGWVERDRRQDAELAQLSADPAVTALRERYLQVGVA